MVWMVIEVWFLLRAIFPAGYETFLSLLYSENSLRSYGDLRVKCFVFGVWFILIFGIRISFSVFFVWVCTLKLVGLVVVLFT